MSHPTLFVDNLTVIDSAYLDAKRGLVGESWIVGLELIGELDDHGMMMDFGLVKKRLKRALDDSLDHTLIVPAQSPRLQLTEEGETVALTYTLDSGETIVHRSPAEAVSLLEADAVTLEAMTAAATAVLRDAVTQNVREARIHLRHEAIPGAFYHYSHGLKKHDGNCQRIAHGHRSPIHIYQDGERHPVLEREWATRLRDSYIGTQEDIVSRSETQIDFAYTSGQGAFTLSLPARCCTLINTDSTVEWIAHYIAHSLLQEHPGNAFRVRAFEGVGKGAIADSAS